jgi:hypothetical protein
VDDFIITVSLYKLIGWSIAGMTVVAVGIYWWIAQVFGKAWK